MKLRPYKQFKILTNLAKCSVPKFSESGSIPNKKGGIFILTKVANKQKHELDHTKHDTPMN